MRSQSVCRHIFHIGMGLLLVIGLQIPALSNSNGKFPGQGNLDDYNRACGVVLEANKYSNKKDYPHALELDRKAISIYPYDAALYFNMGADYESFGKLDDAAKAYEQAVAIEPNYKKAWDALMDCYQDLNNLGPQEKCLRKLMSMVPKNFEYVATLGDVLRKQGRFEEARNFLNQAKSLPASTKSYELLAKILKLNDLHNKEAVKYND